MATLARTNGNAGCTAGLIRHVLNVLSPTTHTLSPLHAVFFQTVLAGKQLSLARAVLDRPVFDVRPKESPVTVEDVLLYFYYGGMINAGLKRFAEALEFFRQVRSR